MSDLSLIPIDLWTLLALGYFAIKNRLLEKLFKSQNMAKMPIYYPLILSIVGLVVNQELNQKYQTYISLTPVLGAIKLPPFTLLFILADFITSMLIHIKIVFPSVKKLGHSRFFRALVDFYSFLMIYAFFTIITTTLWFNQLGNQLNYKDYCFGRQLGIDLVTYYYKNKTLPKRLEEFTNYRENPANGSTLIYVNDYDNHAVITDLAGNQILDSYQDLIGYSQYIDEPQKFFRSFNIDQNSQCQGKLTIPNEYLITRPML